MLAVVTALLSIASVSLPAPTAVAAASPRTSVDWQDPGATARLERLERVVAELAQRVTELERRAGRTAAPLLDESGSLAVGDLQLRSGEYQDRYSVPVLANQRVSIRCSSSEFDTYLIVVVPGLESQLDNDDPAPGRTDAEIEFTAPQAGEVSVIVTSSHPLERGAYRLVATVVGQGENPAPEPKTEAPAASTRLELGTPVRGRLAAGDDRLDGGEYYDVYELHGRAGQSVCVTLTSDQLDPYLIVVPPGADAVQNDDAEGLGRGSQLTFEFAEDGVARVAATSFAAAASGDYVLRADAVESTGPAVGEGDRIGVGSFVDGSLGDGDRTLRSGEWYDVHVFPAHAGGAYSIDLVSDEFDPYLIVIAPGRQQDENDDEGGSRNSRLELRSDADGDYQIVVTSARPGEKGAYTLSVRSAGAERSLGAAVRGMAGAPRNIVAELRESDQRISSGEYARVYPVQLQAGQWLDLTMSSAAFDPYLIVTRPDGTQAENDNRTDGETTAALRLQAAQAGEYRILATTHAAGERGAFRLAMTITEGASPGAPEPAQPTVVAGASRQIDGELARSDERLRSGEFADRYEVHLEVGQSLDVRMTSTAVDPYLIVIRPDGSQEENDDLSQNERAAGVRLDATQAGAYRVMATTYRPGEAGVYRLSIDVGAASDTVREPTPTVDRDGRRTWGVFVGIDQYPSSPLKFCSDDAQHMAEMFEHVGIVPPEQRRILRDRDATVGHVVAALKDVQSRAGPQDMVLFFFSGHGGQKEDPNSTEADRAEEFIMLVDGPLFDDQLAALLDESHAGLTLVYLDSCFSGGFARDIVDRPGRIGVFSSDEDLTSGVAVKFRAGGYLSHFMLRGIGDAEADTDGDHVITTGELTNYLKDSFYRELEPETGAYELRIETRNAASGEPAVKQIQGELAEGDRRLDSGRYVDTHTVQLRAGEWFDVRMSSAQLDPLLIVIAPDGTREECDDVSERDDSAQVRIQARAAGEYRILATAFQRLSVVTRDGERGYQRVQIDRGGVKLNAQLFRLH
ncbi:MAG: caspase family protein [Planctomycetes bacterium]|nr:caspase family protein [Planctomycetota bacterium]